MREISSKSVQFSLGYVHSYYPAGPVPERRNNSIPGIHVSYFRENLVILGINSLPERKNRAIQGINMG